MGSCGCSGVASATRMAKSHIEILPAFSDVVAQPRPCHGLRASKLEVERVRVRSQSFLKLFPHLTDAERFEGGFRWAFLNVPGLERELRALARSEHDARPFLTFVISVQGDELVWQACGSSATEPALDKLYGMIAEPVVVRSPAALGASGLAS
jgi:hypothetical protein